jgi:hypothetical protein
MKLSASSHSFALSSLLLFSLLSISSALHADVITDWNITARDIVVDSKLVTPPANRAVAIVHTSIYEAVNSITQEYPPSDLELNATEDASVDAAVASAAYTSLMALIPQQKPAIEKAYTAALKRVANGNAKQAGITVGKKAAQAILAERANDGANSIEKYRPYTQPGHYVPTVIPAVPQWPNRKPWLLSSASQFRPGPPPALDSKQWARDFNEVKELGAIDSAKRSKEQTEIAKFWEATLPPIYHGVVHSIATQAGRSTTRNARLFALVTQASDDALIAVFDGKYYYGFWRPITAIRNADADDNSETVRDPNWKPYIPTPMHPEYPCAHCVVAATVGVILEAEMGGEPMPLLTTISATANGVSRSWESVDKFVQEVSSARIYDGVHYRTSAEVGTAMGIKIGNNAVRNF